jgi:nucleolar protein 12
MSLVESIFGNAFGAAAAVGDPDGGSSSDKKSKKKNKQEPKQQNSALIHLFDKPTTPTLVGPMPRPKDKDDKDESSSSSSSSSSDDDSSSSSSSDEKEENKEASQPTEEKKSSSKKEEEQDKPAAVEEKDAAKEKDEEPINSINSQQDEEERTVFVGNLPLSTTRKSLAKLFAKCGKVASTRLRSVAVQGVKLPPHQAGNQNLVKKVCTNTKQLDKEAKSSLQGYVVFVDKDPSVENALKLNNTPIPDNDPDATRAVRRIRVDTATPTVDPKRSVFVGNLPYHTEEASLQDHFVQGCGLTMDDVVGVRVIRDKETFQCKGIAYILFADSTMVATALQKMHDTVYLKRNIRVKVCGKSLKGRRGAPKERGKKRGIVSDAATFGGDSNKKRKVESGAMRRLQGKQKKKRARGEKKKNIPGVPTSKPGVSKRVAAEAKTTARIKKIQKRISKGMGKARK